MVNPKKNFQIKFSHTVSPWFDGTMIVLAMLVNMISLAGCFHCQQPEFALISVFAVAGETNSPPNLSSLGFALIFVSQFVQFFIIWHSFNELPFNAVRCAKYCWWVYIWHQMLHVLVFRSFNCWLTFVLFLLNLFNVIFFLLIIFIYLIPFFLT
jgi:hypothetical protein